MPQANRPTLLIATDIFGHTPEVQALARELGAAALVVSPYGGERPRFASEMEAYAAFTARTSIARYTEVLAGRLRERPFDLALGFSVGASALWLCLAEDTPCLPRRAALYYGSRIREHTELTPRCPTRLIFAEHEAAFAPAELTQRLLDRGLDARIIPGSAHGFMNPLSPGYSPQLAAREILQIKSLLG